jgi:hypothetical protein
MDYILWACYSNMPLGETSSDELTEPRNYVAGELCRCGYATKEFRQSVKVTPGFEAIAFAFFD